MKKHFTKFKESRRYWIFLMLMYACLQAGAQLSCVTTGLAGGNRNNGITWNVKAQKDIVIKEVWATFSAATINVELWYNPTDSLNGKPVNPISTTTGWVLIGTSNFTAASAGAGILTQLQFAQPINVPIAAGKTLGFFIKVLGGSNPEYTDRVAASTTIYGDANMYMNMGALVGYGGVAQGNADRMFNGKMCYALDKSTYNNASVSELVSPKFFCPGTQDIKVKVANIGKNIINNLTVQWTVDGALQTAFGLNAPLDTFGGIQYPKDTVLTLGSVFFATAGKTVRAWTEYPNSVVDTVNTDDTIQVVLKAGLNGTYTIGGAAPDYATLADAAADLNKVGVCGPVIFNMVRNSPPSANVSFKKIQGLSSVNNITINGNGNIITSVNSPLLSFEGVSYVTVNNLNIIGGSGFAGFGVFVTNQCHHLTFNKNVIDAGITSTATANAAFVASGSATAPTTAGNNLQYLTFTNNTVIGGYYNFALMGNAGQLDNYGHYIANNVFKDFYIYGPYLGNADSTVFINNDINRATRATVSTLYGLYLATSRNVKVQKNKLHDFGNASYTAYPMYLTNCANVVGYETEISNNSIYNIGTTGIMYGIYSLTTAISNVNIYHNTIQHEVPVTASAIRGIFLSVAITNVNFKNNIINITGAGTGVKTGIYITTASASFYSNNNVIRVATSASNNVGYWTATRATLADWRTASSQDLLSVDVNPQFTNVATGDLKPLSLVTDTVGAPLGFGTDNSGLPRSLVKPDPGSVENIRSENNAGISGFAKAGFCAGVRDVKVRVFNAGTNFINSLYVNWEVNGIPQAPYFWSSPIDTLGGTGRSDTLLTIGSYFFQVGITANIKAWTSIPNSQPDTLAFNDSIAFVMKAGSSGIYSIGAGGNYTSLSDALNDLNYGVCGPVMFELQSNYSTVDETFPLTIPAGLTATDSLVIRPQAGATGLSIAGYNTTAIFDLNGADYVTIDGRPGGAGSNQLAITNTSASPVIRLINDATGNRIRYITATAANTTVASGVIFFSNTTGTAGNSTNLIDHCNINGNSNSVNCIYSAGNAAPADNKNNTVTNCNIYDFFTNVASGAASGVLLEAGNNLWNIGTTGNGNNFYQTAVRNSTTNPALTNAVGFRAVQINNAAVNGCSIVGNRIGGNIPGIPSSVFEIGDLASSPALTSYVRAIDIVAAGTTTATSIQGNIISNITVYSGGTGAAFAGIHAQGGLLNTGNLAGNTIGSPTGNGSIRITYQNTSTSVNIYGIRYTGTAGGLIQNNNIGSITAQATTGSIQMLCIYISGTLTVPLTVSNNLIGSLTTAHSIQSPATSAMPVNIMGLCTSAATGAQVTFSNNTVSNLSSLCTQSGIVNGLKGIYITGASSVGTTVTGNVITKLYSASANPSINESAAIVGINCTSSGAGSQVILNNTISGLSSGTPSTGVTVSGIYYSSATSSNMNRIGSNRIYALTADASNGLVNLNGISLGATATTKVTLSNNMISLGYDSSGASHTGAHNMTGILKTGAIAALLHNSVNIGGTGVGTTVNNTYCYRVSANVSGDSLFNNILTNGRANTSTGGTHFAIGLPNAVNLAINYNLYYTPAGPLGLFNSVTQNALSDWKASTTQDVNSGSAAINYVSNSDLHLSTGSIGNPVLTGTPLPAVPLDYDNAARSATFPYMGADENATPVPVKLSRFTATAINTDVQVQWTTAGERNASHFIVEASVDGSSFRKIGRVEAKGNSSVTNTYIFMHTNAQRAMNGAKAIYYRLTSVDRDASAEQSKVVMVGFTGRSGNPDQVMAYPNPFNNELMLSLVSETGAAVAITITDLQGRVISEGTKNPEKGSNEIMLKELSQVEKGVYFIRINNEDGSKVIKVVKE